MRLIDADALKKAIIRHLCVKSENNLLPAEKSIYNLIDEQQTIEQPKKGEWIEREDANGDLYYDCSACGESWVLIDGTPKENGMDYCPHCGADMRKDGDGE